MVINDFDYHIAESGALALHLYSGNRNQIHKFYHEYSDTETNICALKRVRLAQARHSLIITSKGSRLPKQHVLRMNESSEPVTKNNAPQNPKICDPCSLNIPSEH